MRIKDPLHQCASAPTRSTLLAIGIAAPLVAESSDRLGLEFPDNLTFALIVGTILGGLWRYYRKKRYGDL